MLLLLHPVGNKSVMHWGEFLCASITIMVVGVPFVMYHTGVIDIGAALLGLSGFILAMTTLMCADALSQPKLHRPESNSYSGCRLLAGSAYSLHTTGDGASQLTMIDA